MYLVVLSNITLLQFTSILNICWPSTVHVARHYEVGGAEGTRGIWCGQLQECHRGSKRDTPFNTVNMKLLSLSGSFLTLWTVFVGFSRQENWSGLPFPSPGYLPNPRVEPGSPHCRQTLHHLSHQGSLWVDLKHRKEVTTGMKYGGVIFSSLIKYIISIRLPVCGSYHQKVHFSIKL